MFLRIFCICFLFCTFSQITYSTPFLGNHNNDVNVEQSPFGDLLRYKGEIADRVIHSIKQIFQRGFGVLSNNVNNLGGSVNTLIGATGRLIDDGIAAGRQYGSTIFQGIIFVPKTITDLVLALSENNAFINIDAVRSLSYVAGKPNYLFQFVDEQGRVIPITADVALKLVPNLNV